MSRYGNYSFNDDQSWMGGWDDTPKHTVNKPRNKPTLVEPLVEAPAFSTPSESSSSSPSGISIEINMNTLLLALLFLVIVLVALQIVTYQHVTALLKLTRGDLKV